MESRSASARYVHMDDESPSLSKPTTTTARSRHGGQASSSGETAHEELPPRFHHRSPHKLSYSDSDNDEMTAPPSPSSNSEPPSI